MVRNKIDEAYFRKTRLEGLLWNRKLVSEKEAFCKLANFENRCILESLVVPSTNGPSKQFENFDHAIRIRFKTL